MKTIGLLGGMSWESTSLYYRLINDGIRKHLGGLHSARIVLVSVNFHEIESLMAAGNWRQIADLLTEDCLKIEAAGADCLLVCTNTMHKVAEQIESAIKIPFVHLADTTAQIILADCIKKVGLLGTRFTMEQDFYSGRLQKMHGIDVLIPPLSDMEIIHNVIFQELCKGNVLNSSRTEYLRIIDRLASRGAEAIILGCTEIGMLIHQENCAIKLYDTSLIHAEAAVKFAVK